MKALFISFHAKDYLASKHFYEVVLGLHVQREHAGPPHRFTNYDLGGTLLKVYEWTEPYHGSGHSGLFLATESLDHVVDRLEKAGVTHRGIRVHDWGGRSCSVFDPSGNIFDLIDAHQQGDY
ncbi:MAG: VOC family protein [Bacteroidetes bacterium]|jgi:catechol 2,3-dioxygenase-like lactoylglutathione lyase family enzyme|nr:VOC family protein [Bacteroidota bacterium]